MESRIVKVINKQKNEIDGATGTMRQSQEMSVEFGGPSLFGRKLPESFVSMYSSFSTASSIIGAMEEIEFRKNVMEGFNLVLRRLDVIEAKIDRLNNMMMKSLNILKKIDAQIEKLYADHRLKDLNGLLNDYRTSAYTSRDDRRFYESYDKINSGFYQVAQETNQPYFVYYIPQFVNVLPTYLHALSLEFLGAIPQKRIDDILSALAGVQSELRKKVRKHEDRLSEIVHYEILPADWNEKYGERFGNKIEFGENDFVYSPGKNNLDFQFSASSLHGHYGFDGSWRAYYLYHFEDGFFTRDLKKEKRKLDKYRILFVPEKLDIKPVGYPANQKKLKPQIGIEWKKGKNKSRSFPVEDWLSSFNLHHAKECNGEFRERSKNREGYTGAKHYDEVLDGANKSLRELYYLAHCEHLLEKARLVVANNNFQGT
jgi:hypothetical protein